MPDVGGENDLPMRAVAGEAALVSLDFNGHRIELAVEWIEFIQIN